MNKNKTMITLSEAMDKYYPNYKEMLNEKNLLVVSPTGSGKTYWIFNHLFTDETKKYLYLCDTSNLKRMVMKEPDVWDSEHKVLNEKGELDKIKGFGRRNKSTIAMTYNEFGKKLRELGTNKSYESTNAQIEYVQQFDIIFCDEVHNLFSYSKFTKNNKEKNEVNNYYHAIDKLIGKYGKTKIIFTTATPQSIYDFQDKRTEKYLEGMKEYNALYEEGITDKYINPFPRKPAPILQNFNTIEFTPEEHNIKHYINKRLDYIRDYKDIPNELRKYKEYFKYANGKVLIYISKIEYMKAIKDLLNEIEFIRPIAIWSINNNSEPMKPEQIKTIKNIVDTGYFPDEYNCIIINDAMLTGINIEDPDVQIMIVNSSDDTTIKQSRGRIRNDIDLLVVRAKNSTELNQIKLLEGIDIDKALAECTSKEATKEELEQLILKYDLRDKNKVERQLTVNKLLKELQSLGYTVEKKRKRFDGVQLTVYCIYKI